MKENPVQKLLKVFGGRSQIAKIAGVSYTAVKKWESKGCLPRTEYTGETSYAQEFAQASGGKLSVDELLPKLKPPSAN